MNFYYRLLLALRDVKYIQTYKGIFICFNIKKRQYELYVLDGKFRVILLDVATDKIDLQFKLRVLI